MDGVLDTVLSPPSRCRAEAAVAITGRTALLALVGVVPLALVPGWGTLLGLGRGAAGAVLADLLLAGLTAPG